MSRTAGLLLLGFGAAGLAGAALHLATARQRGIRSAHRGVLAEAASARTRSFGKTGTRVTVHKQRSMSIDERVGILRDVGHAALNPDPKDPQAQADYVAMRKLALQITRHCTARDGICESRAIYDWVRKNIRYTGDVGPHHHGRNGAYEGIDVFQAPARTVEFGGGDCDDHALLTGNLSLHNGIPFRYRITGPSRANNDDWGHIYGMFGIPKTRPRKFVAGDTTLPGQNFGREAPYGKKKDYDA